MLGFAPDGVARTLKQLFVYETSTASGLFGSIRLLRNGAAGFPLICSMPLAGECVDVAVGLGPVVILEVDVEHGADAIERTAAAGCAASEAGGGAGAGGEQGRAGGDLHGSHRLSD